jgi:mannosyltransferase
VTADPRATQPAVSAASSPTERRPLRALLTVVLVAAFVVGIALRFASRVDLWLDETLTVNIARRSLADLPDALRHDGAPPLFYAVLHLWSRVFGSGDFAVRALPGLFGVAMIPLAYASGRMLARRTRVDARTAGISTALIVAVSPFAVRYSTETRMYALAMALVFVGHLALWRALDAPTLPRLALVAGVTAALLYTSYWCAYLVAVILVLVGVRSVAAAPDDRHAARRVLVGILAGCVGFLPWAPILLSQLRHTGTPWGGRPTSPLIVPSAFAQLSGSHHLDGRILTVTVAFLVLVGAWGRHVGRSDRVRATRGAREECLAGVATLMLGLTLAVLADSAFEVRYAAVVFPFLALAAGNGAALLSKNLRRVALALVVVLGVSASIHAITQPRTQAGEIAAGLRAHTRAGDVVVYCPDQVAPDTARVLPETLRLRQFTFPGFGPPDRVDWVDYAQRNLEADPDAFATEAVTRAGANAIWLVWSAGYRTYGDKCERLQNAIAQQRGAAYTIVASSEVFEHMSLVGFGGRAEP